MKRKYYMDRWMLEIAISGFMFSTPGMHKGPAGVRQCFLAVYRGKASDDQFLLTKEVHDYYASWCRSVGKRYLAYPKEAARQCKVIINKRKRGDHGFGHR